MKLAIYQGPSTEGDIDAALAIVDKYLTASATAGADMVVFPELFLPGYNQPDLHKSLAQPKDGPWEEHLAAQARTRGCGITIGWAERDGDAIYNTASCFDANGKKLVHHRKLQLFGPIEQSTFKYGSQYHTFSLNGYKTAVLICYDVEFSHHVQALQEQGVELILVPTANPIAYEYVSHYSVPARAVENRMTIAYANYCGTEGDITYGGKSLIAGPDGTALASAGLGEVLLLADLKIIKTIDQTILSTQHQDRRILK